MEKRVSESANINKLSILGTFEGECADSTITNLNGIDITREVWETLFASEDFQKGIELGHYIGFLGHPEDPNCMDFEHGCIVMTEGHIDADGKVYGKFNLIDTPVGRIVKTFQDSGVQFGISVRGAGDIINNSVDPDTFVFRGFDLVSFPAYPESIPVFKEIAASADPDTRKKYKVLCSAISEGVDNLDTVAAVETLQGYLAKNSEPYAILEKQKSKLSTVKSSKNTDVSKEQIAGLTQLYLSELRNNSKLQQKINVLSSSLKSCKKSQSRKLEAMKRLVASQQNTVNTLEETSRKRVLAARRSESYMKKHCDELLDKLNKSESRNLKYKSKISDMTEDASSVKQQLLTANSKLSKTVRSLESAESNASNLDDKIASLRSELNACKKLVHEYQNSYANLYASAIGAQSANLTITASTSVSELQSMISRTVSHDTNLFEESTPLDNVELVPDEDELIVV